MWHPDTVLITGACPSGADLLTEQCWTAWGGQVKHWPADWTGPCADSCPSGHRRARHDDSTYCPRAGMNRNHAMVTAGRAELCIAFIRAQSHGATQLRAPGEAGRHSHHRAHHTLTGKGR